MTRPDWETYFLRIANAVATRGDCARRQHGAVIVDQYHRIIATGYNGTPPGDPRSCLLGDCPRASSKEPHNSGGYENCISLHAEQNAIANATRDTRGGTIYITGPPCPMCAKLCLAAGLEVKHGPSCKHEWRVEGDDSYEPYHLVCELCGKDAEDPLGDLEG